MTGETTRYTTAENTVSAFRAVALTESDSAFFDCTRAIYVGVGGTVVVTMNDGTTGTFLNALAGMVYPFQITQLKVATTATNIVGLY